MASSTKALPVALIPEQSLVAPVRDDMIHHRCRNDLALCLAESTQRMLLQEKCTGLTPAAVVPTGIRSAAQSVAAPFHMILTEHLTLLAEARTSGIAAGSSWFLVSRQKNGFQNEKQFGGDILLILQRNSNQIVYDKRLLY